MRVLIAIFIFLGTISFVPVSAQPSFTSHANRANHTYARQASFFLGYAHGSKMYAYVDYFYLPNDYNFDGRTEGFTPNLVYTSKLYASHNCKSLPLIGGEWVSGHMNAGYRRFFKMSFDGKFVPAHHVGSIDLRANGVHLCAPFNI